MTKVIVQVVVVIFLLLITIIFCLLYSQSNSQLTKKANVSTTKVENKFKQNNPQQIATDMNLYGSSTNRSEEFPLWKNKTWPNYTGRMFYDAENMKMSPEVKCAIEISRYENRLQGDSLFEKTNTGVFDDLKQDAFCNCDSTYPPKDMHKQNMVQIRTDAGVICN